MHVRRSLAAAFSPSAPCCSLGHAPVMISKQPRRRGAASPPTPWARSVLSGQSFPEAPWSPRCTRSSWRTPATRPTSSWSTPVTATCRRSPTASTSSRSTSAASSTSSTPRRTATRPSRSPPATGQARRRRRRPARRRRHHPARPVRGDRHQRLLRDQGVLRVRGRHQALRPRGQVRDAGRGARLRGSPRLRGRARRPVRHRHHRGAAAGLRQRPDLPVGDQRRVGARRDQHHRRHAGVPGPGGPRGRQADPAGAEPRARRQHRVPVRATRTSPTSSTP